jgi:hypothetical protein
MNIEDWKDLVAGLPCVATYLLTGEKVYGCELHHLESVRDGMSEWLVVPLSPDMHRGPNGMHGLSRRGFYNRYKLDDGALIACTIKLAVQGLSDPGRIALLEAIATHGRETT